MAFSKPPTTGLLLLPPVLLSFVTLILAMILLLAGTGPQQKALEPYHIVAVNLTNFGHDLIPSPATSSPKPTKTGESENIWDTITDGVDDLAQDVHDNIAEGINNITNAIADKVTEELGISDWYSLHVMTACNGMFASDPHAVFNTTNCTAASPGLRLNLTELLNRQIKTGPLKLNLNQIPIPAKVQSAIDTINDVTAVLLVLYALASSFVGLSFLVSLGVLMFVVLRRFESDLLTRRVVWINVVVSAVGTLVLIIASAVVTYVNVRAVREIDAAGGDVGISAIRGEKFIRLSWVAFGLSGVATSFWTLATLRIARRWVVPVGGMGVEKELPY